MRTGSFRRAARELGVSQPTITNQIQRLEEDLGVVLVLRGTKGVRPTYAAERILPHAEAAIRAEDLLRQEVSAVDGMKIGTVRMATVATGSMLVLPGIVKRLHEEHPNIRFEVNEIGTDGVLRGVAGGQYDLGLITRIGDDDVEYGEGIDDSRLHFIDLMSGRLVLCVPDQHPMAHADELNVEDLRDAPLIYYRKGSSLRAAFEKLLGDVQARVIYTTDGAETAQRMVRTGVGIAIANTLAPTTTSGDGVTLIPIPGDWARTRLSVVVRLGELRGSIVQTILRLIRERGTT